MNDNHVLNVEGFTGVYKEIAEIIGGDATYAIFTSMRGQQVTFPKRLYSQEFILKQITNCCNEKNVKKWATEFDYTEKYLRKLLKQLEES